MTLSKEEFDELNAAQYGKGKGWHTLHCKNHGTTQSAGIIVGNHPDPRLMRKNMWCECPDATLECPPGCIGFRVLETKRE